MNKDWFTCEMFDTLEDTINTYIYYFSGFSNFKLKEEWVTYNGNSNINEIKEDIVKEINNNILYVTLEDDNTMYGGTSYARETLEDFINSSETKYHNLNELNLDLVACGIEPIMVRKKHIVHFDYDSLDTMEKDIMNFLENTLLEDLLQDRFNSEDLEAMKEFYKIKDLTLDKDKLLEYTRKIVNDNEYLTMYHNAFFTAKDKYYREMIGD